MKSLKARNEKMVVQEFVNEILIYQLKTNKTSVRNKN